MCPKVQGEKCIKLECLESTCPCCGVQKLWCDEELDPRNANLLSWRKYEMVFGGINKEGKTKEVAQLEHKLTNTRGEFLLFAIPEIHDFIWQTMEWQTFWIVQRGFEGWEVDVPH